MTGTVFLVGAGPGAEDLLTLRAARLLAAADIVFYDALVPAAIVALAPRAQKVAVGKRCGRHATAQRFINKRLADAAAKHRTVVRLKGGDPLLFGRAQEELAYLRTRGIATEVVPGVTAALAAAAELQVSLTQRGISRSVVFATPRAAEGAAPSDWVRAAAAAETVVLYMASREAGAVRAELLAAGVSPRAAATGRRSFSSAQRSPMPSLGRLRYHPAMPNRSEDWLRQAERMVRRIGVFGSYARGDAGVGSDLDLVMRTIAREVRWIWAWTYSTYV